MTYTSVTQAEQRAENGGCRVQGKKVYVPEQGVGIKSWGAVDYLQSQGYQVVRS